MADDMEKNRQPGGQSGQSGQQGGQSGQHNQEKKGGGQGQNKEDDNPAQRRAS